MAGLQKNVASQHMKFIFISATTGAVDSGATPTGFVVKDAGATASTGGSFTNLGSGLYDYAPTQSETNATNVGFLFTTTSDIAVQYNFYPEVVDANGLPSINLVDIAGTTASTTSAQLGVNVVNVGGSASAGAAGYMALDWGHVTGQTTTQSLSNTTISSGQVVASVTGPVGSVTARVTANADQWAGGTIPAPNVTGVPLVDLTYIKGTTSSGAAGVVGIDWAHVVNPTTVVGLTGTTISSSSVSGTVTVGGYTTGQDPATLVWGASTSSFTTAGTFGGSAVSTTQIATAVWTDATSSDFTTTASIGQSLFTGVAPGLANGFIKAGSNAATTFTTLSVGTLNIGGTSFSTTSIASAVWQDTTSGDFTVGSSIGKSLYTSGVVPGGSGGHFISGNNTGTLHIIGSFNIDGDLLLGNSWTIGNGITVADGGFYVNNSLGDGFTVQSTAANGNGFSMTGAGTGAGLLTVGGTTGADISANISGLTMTESYAGLHTNPTFVQAIYELRAILAENTVAGTTVTTKKINGSSVAHTYTIDANPNPTTITTTS